MPRIEIKSIQSKKYKIYNNVCQYVAREDRCQDGYIGATNLYLPQRRSEVVEVIKEQVEEAREFYGKQDNRLALHVVIAFSVEELKYLSQQQMMEIAYYIAETEFPGCPTYFAIHDHTEQYHIDMMLIPINLITGNMYGCEKTGWNKIEMDLRTYLTNYMPEDVVGEHQVAYSKYGK